jgi:hypothetical protein
MRYYIYHLWTEADAENPTRKAKNREKPNGAGPKGVKQRKE